MKRQTQNQAEKNYQPAGEKGHVLLNLRSPERTRAGLGTSTLAGQLPFSVGQSYRPITGVNQDALAAFTYPFFSVGPVVSIDAIREGFDRPTIDQVAAMALLTKKEIATLLGVSERHLYNATNRPLSALQSEHLVNLAGLFAHGLLIFDNDGAGFSQWLRSPKHSLAVPQTGFDPVVVPGYEKPTLARLFAVADEQMTNQAMEQNMAYNREQAAGQTKSIPTPLSILDTATGVGLVSDILGRIDAGVFS